jgi:hypothetical protein
MIPPFTVDGLLPPGVHEADGWEEVVSRFGGTTERQALLARLRSGLANLRNAGSAWVLLDGSFVTNKPDPADVDGCWDDTAIDLHRLDPCFLLRSRADRLALRARYGMDFFPAGTLELGSGKPFVLFFQTDREGRARGLVRLSLARDPSVPGAEP